jgi:LysR family nitrogen assimilation transcriptional regulator
LTIAEGLSPILTERVLLGAVDMAVLHDSLKDARLASEAMLEEELYLVGRTDIIGRSRSAIVADIPQQSGLGLNPVPASRSIIQTQNLRDQIASSPTLEIDSLNAMRKA